MKLDNYDYFLMELFKNLSTYSVDWRDTLDVTFTIDAEYWKGLRKKGKLGQLYGVDLGNYLSRRGILNEYILPQVSDKSRASKGLKTIKVTYYSEGLGSRVNKGVDRYQVPDNLVILGKRSV